ncbi:MAG: hypothetical protein IPO63_10115 [Bacteroidetes bacterium]|nr:hypothetical protein [Bacteroidota bacterium]
MKKFLLAAAFVTVCSFSSALAQTAVQSEKAAVATDVQQSEIAKEKPAAKPAASCCSKKSKDAKACSDKEKGEKSAAGKSSCCQKGGHTDAKAEEKGDATHKH